MGILEDFSRRQAQKREAVPFQGFGSREDLLDHLHNKKYVLMTAQNPKVDPKKGPFEGPANEPPMSEKNVEAFRMLMRDLDKKNLLYTTHKGAWQGDPEFSLIVWAPIGTDEDKFFIDMQDLAEDYGQQAFMRAEPGARSVIYTTEEAEEKARKEQKDPEAELRPETYDELKEDTALDPGGFTNVTPHGPDVEEFTGTFEPDIRFEEEKPYPAELSAEPMYWHFEAKDFDDLSPEQQKKVMHHMEVKEKARDPQRKKRRSDH